MRRIFAIRSPSGEFCLCKCTSSHPLHPPHPRPSVKAVFLMLTVTAGGSWSCDFLKQTLQPPRPTLFSPGDRKGILFAPPPPPPRSDCFLNTANVFQEGVLGTPLGSVCSVCCLPTRAPPYPSLLVSQTDACFPCSRVVTDDYGQGCKLL